MEQGGVGEHAIEIADGQIERACPEFCVNGAGLKVGHPLFKLDSKASQRRFPIANGHGPFLTDVS